MSELMCQRCCVRAVVAELLWQSCCGRAAVAELLWQSCCGRVAVAELLWQSCCGRVAVAELLWQSCCGRAAVAELLWQSCCGRVSVSELEMVTFKCDCLCNFYSFALLLHHSPFESHCSALHEQYEQSAHSVHGRQRETNPKGGLWYPVGGACGTQGGPVVPSRGGLWYPERIRGGQWYPDPVD